MGFFKYQITDRETATTAASSETRYLHGFCALRVGFAALESYKVKGNSQIARMAKRPRNGENEHAEDVDEATTKQSDAFNAVDADFTFQSAPDEQGVSTLFRLHKAKLAAAPKLNEKVEALLETEDAKPVLILEEEAAVVHLLLRLLYDGQQAVPNLAFTPLEVAVALLEACVRYDMQDYVSLLDQSFL